LRSKIISGLVVKEDGFGMDQIGVELQVEYEPEAFFDD
jgi:hypothetical protein